MRLGLGLGLNKGGNLLSNLKLLTRNSDFAFWIDKATGTSKGTNSPQVNPIVDLVGVVGKNLFDISRPFSLQRNGDTILGSVRRIYSNVALLESSEELYYLKPNTQYSLSFLRTYNGARNELFTQISCDGTDYYITVQNVSRSFTTGATGNAKIGWGAIGGSSQIDGYVDFTNIQLEEGTVATAYEPYGKANGLLQGFGFTPASGYVDVVAPNGKTVTGTQGDGVNDVIVLPSNAPNPTTGSFAFGLVVKTGTNKVKYLLTRNDTSDTDTQYAFKMDASGNLFVILEGVAIQIGTTLSVGFHSIWLERDSGTLKSFIDGVETYSGAHSITLTSRANTVMMASTTGAGTYTGFSNDLLLATKYCDSDIAKNRADWFKFDTKAYGL